MPPCPRKRPDRQFLHLRAKRWGDDRFSQKTNACTLFWPLLVELRAHLADKRRPGTNVFTIRQSLRAIGIVKIQDRRLSKDVSGTGTTRIAIRIFCRKIQGRLLGCSGLPSILVGRPSLLRTSTGVAAPNNGAAVA